MNDLIEQKPVSKWRKSIRVINSQIRSVLLSPSLREVMNTVFLIQMVGTFCIGFVLDEYTELSQGAITLWIMGGLILAMAEVLYFNAVLTVYEKDDR